MLSLRSITCEHRHMCKGQPGTCLVTCTVLKHMQCPWTASVPCNAAQIAVCTAKLAVSGQACTPV